MLNHNYIGTEHLLLGLIHEGEGVAAFGIILESVRAQVQEVIGQGQTPLPDTFHLLLAPRRFSSFLFARHCSLDTAQAQVHVGVWL
jgi:ATP-dependent Clp protease ATP-binding subunit ClpA